MLCLWYLHGYFLKTPLLDVLKDYFFNMENFLQTSSTIIHWRPMLADEFTSFISHSHFSFHHFYTISLMGLFCIANMATYTCITISSNCKLWFHSKCQYHAWSHFQTFYLLKMSNNDKNDPRLCQKSWIKLSCHIWGPEKWDYIKTVYHSSTIKSIFLFNMSNDNLD